MVYSVFTKLMNESFYWLANKTVSTWKSPQENITNEIVLTSVAMTIIFCLDGGVVVEIVQLLILKV